MCPSQSEYIFRRHSVCCSVALTLKSVKILDLLSSCREPQLYLRIRTAGCSDCQ